MDYIVKLENFEGPFDVLLDVIKRREMNIFDLHISHITSDYLAAIDAMKDHNIEVTSEFMEIASLLLHIKSKLMLPTENEGEDPREELVQQLLDYKEYKEAVEKMKHLKEMEQKFFKTQKKIKIKKKKEGSANDLAKLYEAIFLRQLQEETVQNSPFSKLADQLSQSNFTMEDRMDHLKQLVDQSPILVQSYFEHVWDREELIVTFGAMLELVKSQYAAIQIEEELVYIVKREVPHG